MRSGPASTKSNARYRTPRCRSATVCPSRISVLPSSIKRPPLGSSRSEASVNSPASEFSTTSTPLPSVARRNASSNSNDRESEIWISSKPIARNVSHLARLAVTKTSAPQYRANDTAAIPTPPVPACTNTFCPAATSANTDSP
ncbi:Uncharacterised protein [Mycobacterium tuberculosis]|nr:Uncharacterised protein [Mycobacterium tuberculosis]